MRVPAFLRKYSADRRATTAIMFALTLPVIVGAAGLGVETGFWYFKKRELQTAADVAAFAGAVEKRGGGTSAEIDAVSLSEAVEHGYVTGEGTIDVNDPPLSGTHQNAQSVEVLLTMPADRFFSGFFAQTEVTLHARGVASFNDGGQACILALAPEAMGAVTFTGNALTLIDGCNVMSNSLHDSALIVSGSADVTVPCVLSAGGVSVDEGLTLTECSEAQSNVPPANDPFNSLAEPAVAGPCLSLPGGNATATLNPGRYCGGGNLMGDKTFNPGTYIIDGGTFRINAGADVVGSEVTFFLTNGATVDFNGSAEINLAAPTSGANSGVLFWGDDSNAFGSNKFNGNASSLLTGALYFPTQEVEFLGNFSGDNGCMRIVAYTVKVTGSTTMSADCTAAGFNSMPLPGAVTLVE